MDRTFGSARRVLVWLGGEDRFEAFGNFSHTAFTSLRKYAKNDISVENDQGTVDALEHIIQRPWFERMWCVQAVVLASKATVLCGSDEISWRTFSKGLEVAVEEDIRFTNSAGAVQRNDLIGGKLRSLPLPEKPRPNESRASFLLRMLLRYRSRQSTDPRDKEYALFGLISRYYDGVGLDASYTKPTRETCTDAARIVLQQAQDLRLLEACDGADPVTQISLPSWVPDWSYTGHLAKPLSLSTGDNHRHFKAASRSERGPSFKEHGTVLGLRGVIFVSIPKVGSTLPSTELQGLNIDIHMLIQQSEVDKSMEDEEARRQRNESSMAAAGQRMLSVLKQLKVFFEGDRTANKAKIAKGNDLYCNGESRRAAYLSTLCAGNIRGSYEKTSKLYDEWHDSLQGMRLADTLQVDQWHTYAAGMAHILLPLVRKWRSWNEDSEFTGLLEHAYHRRFAKTSKGYYCLVPSSAREGDLFGVFQGGHVPLVIREFGEDWKLVGESYVHGIMQREAYKKGSCKVFWFR